MLFKQKQMFILRCDDGTHILEGLGLIASCYDKVVIVWDSHLEITTNATYLLYSLDSFALRC